MYIISKVRQLKVEQSSLGGGKISLNIARQRARITRTLHHCWHELTLMPVRLCRPEGLMNDHLEVCFPLRDKSSRCDDSFGF